MSLTEGTDSTTIAVVDAGLIFISPHQPFSDPRRPIDHHPTAFLGCIQGRQLPFKHVRSTGYLHMKYIIINYIVYTYVHTV